MASVRRVSDYYNLGVEQGGLDFVDVDVIGDVPVYLDPTAIRVQSGDWVEACAESVYTFFQTLLDAIRTNDLLQIRTLVYPLTEPNETHLGVSSGPSRGRSLGSRKKADELIEALRRSRAIKSGLIEDLEDTVLFVEGIGADILSDITTCVIRKHLIDYTVNQARFHGMPLVTQTSGKMWDSATRTWFEDFIDLPRGPKDTLILVPKAIVRLHPTYDRGKFYRGYLRPFFEEEEMAKGTASAFVKLVRKGKRDQRLKIMKGELDESLGTSKNDIAANAERFPRAVEDYREAKAAEVQIPLSQEALAEGTGVPEVSLRDLYEEVLAVRAGRAGATAYHRAIAAFLTALFTGSLGNDRLEVGLHNGMKRMDIRYDNVAGDGLFWWLGQHYKAASIVVECKNYEKEPGNPELDQLAMRLTPDRGQVGLLLCRRLSNKSKFLERCRTAAIDGHGYVIALDDDDLAEMLDDYEQAAAVGDDGRRRYPLVRKRFDLLLGLS